MNYRIVTGNSLVKLQDLGDHSVDSIVTDPPYELTSARPGGRSEATKGKVMKGFMGMQWDGTGIAYSVELWMQCLRVLKPGGHLLAFGGARTYHRLACAVEDAGFDIRDQMMWIFGSGFPKSHNLEGDWDGWGTALKPAHEPIVVARKPLIGTVAENVQQHGTGAMNIKACRIPGEAVPINRLEKWSGFGQEKRPDYEQEINMLGRWPANLIHDGSEEVVAAFPDAPGQMADASTDAAQRKTQNVYGAMRRGSQEESRFDENEGAVGFKMKPGARRLDEGSAARFFYCAKASREDRNEGCEEFAKKPLLWSSGTQSPGTFQSEGTERAAQNNHPTVKPTELMRYLCRLVTPEGGTVLDPFMGSGSTGKAAMMERFNFIGIELSEEYAAIAEARLAAVTRQGILL